MSFTARSKFEFHKNGNANRRESGAYPRVLLLAHATEPDTADFAGVVVHFAGDEFTREVPRHSINGDLIADMAPLEAFELGRLIEGGVLEGTEWSP